MSTVQADSAPRPEGSVKVHASDSPPPRRLRMLRTAAGLGAAWGSSWGWLDRTHPYPCTTRTHAVLSAGEGAAFHPLKPGDFTWPQGDSAPVLFANHESHGSHCRAGAQSGGGGASVRAPPCPLRLLQHPGPARLPPALDTQPSIPNRSSLLMSWSCRWGPRAIRAKSCNREGTQDE